jgi:hypothetical protein
MKHILGMAKSHLDLKGAKASKLELDYLRLIYAVKEIRKQGDSVQGYLVVMTDEILNRVRQWEYKYQGKEFVDLHSISLTGRGRHRLENEKAMNLAGMVAGATGGKAAGRSIADAGRNIGEAALKEIVLRLEPNVRMVMDRNRFPLGMRWDFYGIVE